MWNMSGNEHCTLQLGRIKHEESERTEKGAVVSRHVISTYSNCLEGLRKTTNTSTQLALRCDCYEVTIKYQY
jgi:hypothetical protein